MNAHDDSDPDFSRYAAAHGIQTLNGGGGGSTEASADDLRLEHLEKDKPVKLDGVLGEWPPLAKADVVVAGSGATTSMTVGLLYDEVKLYVGAEVNDPSFVAGQSHVSLLLAVPEPGGSYAPYELGIYPGKPGESEGAVRFGRRATVGGAKIVEATTAGGYTLEAAIPWIALPAARTTRVGIHGVARYASGENVIATGPGDAAHPTAMPWIPSEPELSMIEQLLGPKGLAKTAPIAESVADLTGDGVRERVAVFDRYLTICGTSYLGGTGFFFRELAGELVKIEVRDVAGRGHADVIVRRREGVGDGTRETLEVLSAMDATTAPRVTFAHEIEVRQSDRRIDNVVRLGRGEIEVSVEPATGWDAASYKEPISSEVEPILLPWGAVRTQTWRWDGSRFAKAKEVLQPEARPGSAGAGEADDEAAPPRPAEPPTPAVTRGGDLSAQVLDAFRRDRGLSAEVRPKVDLQVQVTGDDHPERVLLIGRDIVVLGPGFKGGTGYSYTTLSPFADAADVKDLSARDLTGDGDADLVVRGVRHLNVDHAPFDSELLLVYQVDDGGTITRIFGIESGREQGRKRVQGLVQFVPSPGGRSFDILAEKGRAFGWTAKTYPWSQQADRGGDVEPLLLPWGSVSSVRYSWNGSQFAKSGD
ncbi:MAG: hypothetical protein ABSC94_07385 [Polyangiaceae bacterium]